MLWTLGFGNGLQSCQPCSHTEGLQIGRQLAAPLALRSLHVMKWPPLSSASLLWSYVTTAGCVSKHSSESRGPHPFAWEWVTGWICPSTGARGVQAHADPRSALSGACTAASAVFGFGADLCEASW